MAMALVLSQLMTKRDAATVLSSVLMLIISCTLVPVACVRHTIADSFRGDVRSCEASCEASFLGDDATEETRFSFCRRGCRLLNLIDILDDFSNLNDTKTACFKSCEEVYFHAQNVEACMYGCESQLPSAENRKKQMQDYLYNKNLDNLSPFLYINKVYTNMIEKTNDRISRSYFTQSEDGRLVVVAAKSSFSVDFETDNFEGSFDSGLSLESVVDKSLQMNKVEMNGIPPGSGWMNSSFVWHTCIIRKTGASRPLVVSVIVLLAILAVWIWIGSAAMTKKMFDEEQNLKQLPYVAVAASGNFQIFIPDPVPHAGILNQLTIKLKQEVV